MQFLYQWDLKPEEVPFKIAVSLSVGFKPGGTMRRFSFKKCRNFNPYQSLLPFLFILPTLPLLPPLYPYPHPRPNRPLPQSHRLLRPICIPQIKKRWNLGGFKDVAVVVYGPIGEVGWGGGHKRITTLHALTPPPPHSSR